MTHVGHTHGYVISVGVELPICDVFDLGAESQSRLLLKVRHSFLLHCQHWNLL